MKLDKAQKETCRRMTERAAAGDAAALGFFSRLKSPMKEAFEEERTRMIGTVQQNEYGLPDEPTLKAEQVGSMIRNARATLEGDPQALNYVEKIKGHAKDGQAYAQAMMRVYDAVVSKIQDGIIEVKKGASPGAVRVVTAADGSKTKFTPLKRPGSLAPAPVVVTHTPEPPSTPDIGLLDITSEPHVQKISTQVEALLGHALLTAKILEGSEFTETAAMLAGLKEKDPIAVHLAANVFASLFMPSVVPAHSST
jgi:hypothetical protein